MICDLEYQSLTSFLERCHHLPVPETNHLHFGDFISRRLEERSCTLGEYLDGLPTDLQETKLAIDAATIGETYFFRDESHFSLLLYEFLPFFSQLGRVPLAWSAAASTGEEALSIA
ncbi:MAG: CheR family methyltransferase, partial [Spirochaetota bacterium]